MIIFGFQTLILIASVIVLCRKRKSMPTFVIQIWACLIAGDLLLIVQLVITVLANHSVFPSSDLFYRFYWYNVGLITATNSLAHWIFAMEYFKVALRFPIIIDLFHSSTNEKIKLTNRIFNFLNYFYYTLLVVWIFLVLALQFAESEWSFYYDIFMKVLSVVVLVLSMCILSR